MKTEPLPALPAPRAAAAKNNGHPVASSPQPPPLEGEGVPSLSAPAPAQGEGRGEDSRTASQGRNRQRSGAGRAETEYRNLVDLLAVYSEASHRLDELRAEANRDFLDSIDEHRAEYAQLQETLARAEAALETIALAHPEWFGKRKSLKTPYGTVKFHQATKLLVPNPEATLLLLEQTAAADRDFHLDTFTRLGARELDLEALAKLDDPTLARLRIQRVTDDSFSVVAARVDLGKAVKEGAME